jgi:hypothetical protein
MAFPKFFNIGLSGYGNTITMIIDEIVEPCYGRRVGVKGNMINQLPAILLAKSDPSNLSPPVARCQALSRM